MDIDTDLTSENAVAVLLWMKRAIKETVREICTTAKEAVKKRADETKNSKKFDTQ